MTFLDGRIARLSLALAVVGAGFVVYSILAEGPPGTDGTGSGDVVNLEVDYAFEPTDERQLVGFATNVFVGRVVGKVGTEGAPVSGPQADVIPRAQFSVAVLNNIKGDLGGNVTVSQTGGYDKSVGREVRIEGDPLLKPGQVLLFATSYDREEGWYTVAAQPFGTVPIENGQQKTNLVERFTQAREHQIPFDPTGAQ
jgi:hypothetical protein